MFDKSISPTYTIHMNSKRTNQIIDVFLFAASFLGLFIIWGFVINALLVPWDGTLPQDRPPLGSSVRTINDYFETASFGSYLPYIILFGISLLIVLLRIKKKGLSQVFQLLEHTAVSNFLYIGFLVTLFFVYLWLTPSQTEAAYNPVAIIIHLVGIIVLFAVQYTGYTLHRKS
jgi:hypothetical protein